MIIDCILWSLAIYGFLHICIDVFFQVVLRSVEVLVKVNNIDTLEMLAKMMKYKLWYFNKVECELKNDIRITEEDKIVVDKIYKDYGIRFITK